MFWDHVAGVYDIFANVINAKVHRELCEKVAALIAADDEVLECACGTGMLSAHIAPECKSLVATDFSSGMLKRARAKCRKYANVEFKLANISALDFADNTFDVVVAGNVIHLLDEPAAALGELNRVCKTGGKLIIPTYMNKRAHDDTSGFIKALGKAGADFKKQFTFSSYKRFFADAGYTDAVYTMIEGRVPCALAVLRKR